MQGPVSGASASRRRFAEGLAGAVSVLAGSLLASAFVAASFLVPGPAWAQAGSEPGLVDRKIKDLPPALQREGVQVTTGEGISREGGDPAKVLAPVLNAVSFEGAGTIPEAILQGAAAPFLGKQFTQADLVALKYDLTRVYFDSGYPLVRVTTPPQDLSGGVLKVVVYEARIGSVTVQNDALNAHIARQMTRRLREGEVFEARSVESAVNDVNDLGNVRGRLNLKPGTEVGTTDLTLLIEQQRDDVNTLAIDNYGAALTGELVGSGEFNFSNLLGLGETFTVGGRKSEDHLHAIEAGFRSPIGFRNLMVEANFLRSENEIGDRLKFLGAEGESLVWGVALSSALINNFARQAVVRVGFESRSFESELFGIPESDDDLRQVYLEGTYLVRFPRGLLYGALRIAKGVDALGASDEGDLLLSRARGDPQAFRVQPLVFGSYQVTDRGRLTGLFTAQLSDSITLSSDLFAIGGYGSVRGFEPAEETGEGGATLSVEYHHRVLTQDRWAVELGPFFDAGWVSNRLRSASEDPQLYSAGIGVEAYATVLPIGQSRIRFDWAHTLGGYDSTSVDSNTFYFRVQHQF